MSKEKRVAITPGDRVNDRFIKPIAMPWVAQCSACDGTTLYTRAVFYLNGKPLVDTTEAQ